MDKSVMQGAAQAPTLELRDIHLPGDPSIWPLAPGWWLLIIIACVVLYFAIKKLTKFRQQKHMIYLLQSELSNIRNDFKKHNNKHTLAGHVSALLNRFVKYVLNDSIATSLTGKDWINYLNSRVKSEVFNKFEVELTQAQYMKNVDFDVPSLIATVRNYFPQAMKNRNAYNKIENSKGGSNA